MSGSGTSTKGASTVLVIEDNSDDALLLQLAALEVCPDVAFQFVPDGLQALDYLKGEAQFTDRHTCPFPDLILLDLRLPGMDGFQVLKHIRRLPGCDGLKVLAWSDGSDPAIGARAREAGVDYFMPKPFSFENLVEEVTSICDLARTARG